MILRLTAIRTENQAFDEQVCSDFFDVVGHDLFSQGLGDVDAAEGEQSHFFRLQWMMSIFFNLSSNSILRQCG